MNAIADIYQSRGSARAGLVRRRDPVVYNEDPAQAPLDYVLIEKYIRDGFLVIEGLFSEQEIDHLQQEMVRLRADTDTRLMEETITEAGNGEVRSIFRVHAISSIFRRLAEDLRLTKLAHYILDDDIYLHQSRLNYKPGFHGKEFYWHSDFETWHMEDGMPAMRSLSVSILLTENYAYNGPLMLVPGSHMEYVICPGDTPEDHYKQSLKKQEYGVPPEECLAEIVNRYGITLATGRPGTVILFDSNTMHGSNGNISPYPRSNVFYVYNALSNRLQNPCSGQAPRPEFIASRKDLHIITPRRGH